MSKIVNFNRFSKVTPVRKSYITNENYIAPASEDPVRDYALQHHHNFKGFWENPLVLIQNDAADGIVFDVYLIPEVVNLLHSNSKYAESIHANTVTLFVRLGIFSKCELGHVRIVEEECCRWVAIPDGIPAEYERIALTPILQASNQLGLDIHLQNMVDIPLNTALRLEA